MRRPLKPFVTEYKTTNRKPKDLFEAVSSARTADPPQDFAPEGARTAPPGDDNYEAALRAADALFAGKPNALPSDDDASSAAARAPEHLGGRILQAIDDDAVDPLAAMEAERAPKKRGRKPGSKNRPKLPVAAVETIEAEVPTPAKPRKRPVETQVPALLVAPPASANAPRERFGWVRTTLRPGERWKRRLPKVAW